MFVRLFGFDSALFRYTCTVCSAALGRFGIGRQSEREEQGCACFFFFLPLCLLGYWTMGLLCLFVVACFGRLWSSWLASAFKDVENDSQGSFVDNRHSRTPAALRLLLRLLAVVCRTGVEPSTHTRRPILDTATVIALEVGTIW